MRNLVFVSNLPNALTIFQASMAMISGASETLRRMNAFASAKEHLMETAMKELLLLTRQDTGTTKLASAYTASSNAQLTNILILIPVFAGTTQFAIALLVNNITKSPAYAAASSKDAHNAPRDNTTMAKPALANVFQSPAPAANITGTPQLANADANTLNAQLTTFSTQSGANASLIALLATTKTKFREIANALPKSLKTFPWYSTLKFANFHANPCSA